MGLSTSRGSSGGTHTTGHCTQHSKYNGLDTHNTANDGTALTTSTRAWEARHGHVDKVRGEDKALWKEKFTAHKPPTYGSGEEGW